MQCQMGYLHFLLWGPAGLCPTQSVPPELLLQEGRAAGDVVQLI